MSQFALYSPTLRALGFTKEWDSRRGSFRSACWRKVADDPVIDDWRVLSVVIRSTGHHSVAHTVGGMGGPSPTYFANTDELRAGIEHEATRRDNRALIDAETAAEDVDHASNIPEAATSRVASDFEQALSRYERLKSASDALDHFDEASDAAEEALDAYCVAMDHLIEQVPAPDLNALNIKLGLMEVRCGSGEGPYEEYWAAIRADVHRLALSQTDAAGVTTRVHATDRLAAALAVEPDLQAIIRAHGHAEGFIAGVEAARAEILVFADKITALEPDEDDAAASVEVMA